MKKTTRLANSSELNNTLNLYSLKVSVKERWKNWGEAVESYGIPFPLD